ncbi:TetR/AcrR family transcriptional regulator [Saccharopolyspora shandongensis]|uniref:Transcriptional regulator, TetR family n=1 Tax=Saccharopolyspora shandongensis TaxID=418495 RepID=A0A1H3DEL9_9PSEU|nr:TetR/AcrR family transcriptional regulator [Saccharopolyspora shandongensis]SDX64821.1 transcriptional regulator, TetR family [Saccharopolyspora shandongensis]
MAATAAQVTSVALRLTAERGLSGFTVEEVCEQVDISRRTFFNYFASKDDAVLGITARKDEDALTDQFLARGDSAGTGLSPTLLDDLAELAVQRWERADITAESIRDVLAAFEREPRLLTRFVEKMQLDEQSDVELVEQREGLAPGDLRAAAAVQVIRALISAGVREFLTLTNSDSFAEILARRLAAARELFAPNLERKS